MLLAAEGPHSFWQHALLLAERQPQRLVFSKQARDLVGIVGVLGSSSAYAHLLRLPSIETSLARQCRQAQIDISAQLVQGRAWLGALHCSACKFLQLCVCDGRPAAINLALKGRCMDMSLEADFP